MSTHSSSDSLLITFNFLFLYKSDIGRTILKINLLLSC